MSERVDKCRSCSARDVDPQHVERCAIRTKARAAAIAAGRGDVGIHAARTADLWAHFVSRNDDPMAALNLTRVVIDLGWRPVIGLDAWTPPATAPATTTNEGGE